MSDNCQVEKRNVVVILGDHRYPDRVKRGGQFNSEDFDTIEKLKQALRQLERFTFIFMDKHKTLEADLATIKDEVWLVMNLCDEGLFNDPAREKDIPLILENLGLHYTGAGASCIEKCYDKALTLDLAQKRGVPIPQSYEDWLDVTQFPVIVKPRKGDGGFGIYSQNVVHNAPELIRALNFMRVEMNCSDLLIQEFLTGKDLTCGIIGDEVLPIIEDDYSGLPKHLPPIQGYEAKWHPESPYWKVKSKPADLMVVAKHIISDYTRLMFSAMGCRDYARIDWRLDAKGIPCLLEVNPNPGWSWDGHLAKSWSLTERSYSQMLLAIIKTAAQRYNLS